MIKIAILVSLLALATTAPSGFGPKCVEDRMEMVKKMVPEGYLRQLNQMMQCKGPQFYHDCYEKAFGYTIPKNFESLINMTCTPPDVTKSQNAMACIMNSKESAFNAVSKFVENFMCQMNVIGSNDEGFLCDQWKKVGAEKAAESAHIADNWFKFTSRFLTDAAPQDLKSCAALLPTKSSEMLDMICDRSWNARAHKLEDCLTANTTVRAVVEIGMKIKPRFG